MSINTICGAASRYKKNRISKVQPYETPRMFIFSSEHKPKVLAKSDSWPSCCRAVKVQFCPLYRGNTSVLG